MHSERYWRADAVIMLGSGLMISLSLGMLATLALKHWSPDLPATQERFYNFLISSFCFQGAGLVLAHFFLKNHAMTWAEFLGLKGPQLQRALVTALVVVVVILPPILLLNELMRVLITRIHSEPSAQPTLQILEISVSLPQRIWFGFTAIVIAPLVEETLFRGILYRTIKQRGFPMIALLGSSLLFAAIHGSVMTLVPLTVLAIIFALLYDRTDNLMAPIFAHAVFNAVNFFAYIYRDDLTEWWKQLAK